MLGNQPKKVGTLSLQRVGVLELSLQARMYAVLRAYLGQSQTPEGDEWILTGGHRLKLGSSCGYVKFGPWTEHAVTARGSLGALKTGENSVPTPVIPDKCFLVQIASILALQQSQSVCGYSV